MEDFSGNRAFKEKGESGLNELRHYGVKGMRWGVRKKIESTSKNTTVVGGKVFKDSKPSSTKTSSNVTSKNTTVVGGKVFKDSKPSSTKTSSNVTSKNTTVVGGKVFKDSKPSSNSQKRADVMVVNGQVVKPGERYTQPSVSSNPKLSGSKHAVYKDAEGKLQYIDGISNEELEEVLDKFSNMDKSYDEISSEEKKNAKKTAMDFVSKVGKVSMEKGKTAAIKVKGAVNKLLKKLKKK